MPAAKKPRDEAPEAVAPVQDDPEAAALEQDAPTPTPPGVHSLGNPWDRAYEYGEHPPAL